MTKHKITMHMHQAAILQAAPQPPPDVLVPALRAKIHEAKKNSERAELKAALERGIKAEKRVNSLLRESGFVRCFLRDLTNSFQLLSRNYHANLV